MTDSLYSVSEEYAPGLWRPAVPVPYYGVLHVRCACGRRFWFTRHLTPPRYERHYRAEHIHWTERGWCVRG